MIFRNINIKLNNSLSKFYDSLFKNHPKTYLFLELLLKSIKEGSLGMRASSISFNFLLAIGPAIIFVLSIIPFLPIYDLKSFLLPFLKDIMPQRNYDYINDFINELFQKRKGLTLFGFLLSIFFAYKGINGMIDAFNKSIHYKNHKNWLYNQIISLFLVFLLIFLLLFSTMLFIYNQRVLNFIAHNKLSYSNTLIFNISKWIILYILTFATILSLYYFAPSRKTKFKYYITGSLFASLLCIITSLIFSYFVNNFAPFNKVFGSIGTLIAFLLWMNFNALALLIGFEINVCLLELKKINRKDDNK